MKLLCKIVGHKKRVMVWEWFPRHHPLNLWWISFKSYKRCARCGGVMKTKNIKTRQSLFDEDDAAVYLFTVYGGAIRKKDVRLYVDEMFFNKHFSYLFKGIPVHERYKVEDRIWYRIKKLKVKIFGV